MKKFRVVVGRLFKLFGFSLIRSATYHRLDALGGSERRLRFLIWGLQQGGNLIQMARQKSQIQQDLFVLVALSFKTEGFFVEFGATDGKSLSNTWLLEKEYNWEGVLAEPARLWEPALRSHRDASVDTRLVWSDSGETVRFWEADSAELSTAERFSKSDEHALDRKKGKSYEVKTVSLTDLLRFHGAPSHIDYLSIDTEGSELLILQGLDFRLYQFSVITVEHNFRIDRLKIQSLLEAQGYRRVIPELSAWDDWYLHSEISLPREGLLLPES